MRTLFDASLGVFSLDGAGGRDTSYSLLMIFYVSFSNILLLNFLIAILSTTYENMKQNGVFRYKVNVHWYSMRFQAAFESKTYGELWLHPGFISLIALFILPCIGNKKRMESASIMLAKANYWVENFLMMLLMFFIEFFLLPVIYLLIFY